MCCKSHVSRIKNMLLCFRQPILILKVNVRFITFCFDVLHPKK